MSRSDAVLRGSISYSELISFAIGPASTMAIVLLAVARSTPATSAAMLTCAPFLVFVFLCIKCRIASIPPNSLTRAAIAATVMEITVISYMEVTPPPMLVKISPTAIAPVATPAITEVTVPTIRTMKTLIPASAPTSTRI